MTAARQETAQPFASNHWHGWVTTSLALLLFVGAVVGTVWTAASVIAEKADKSDVYQMREDLNEVKTDVAVIRAVIEKDHKGQ